MKITTQKALKDLEAVCLCAANQELIKMPADLYRRFGKIDQIENMVSNLPLLFAGGYPTSLDKITESQLENFIPFMVQCSLGEIQSPVLDSSCEPEWWPEDVPFTIPLRKPTNFTEDWFSKLKQIVAICYQFHKSVFLLRFCENLSAYQPESLRFINNYNSTTSLFDRVSNKLLVTFRNENMLYDQPRVNNKKTLMPKMQNSQSGEPHQMVEQSLFDIYLCDNCEAELYSYEAYQEHEKTCQSESVAFESDDDDVIFCGQEEQITKEPEDTTQQQNSFLQLFQLCKKTTSSAEEDVKPFKAVTPHKRIVPAMSMTGCSSGVGGSSSSFNNNNTIFSNKHSSCVKNLESESNGKVRRGPRRAPGIMVLLKSQIPITSPAGQRLISQSNTIANGGYIRERIERYERFCTAPPLAPDGSNRPKFLDKKPLAYTVSTFRNNTKHFHCYKFPRRQFSTKRRNDAVAQLERIQLQQTKCKPIQVTVQRLSTAEIENIRTQVKESQLKRRKLSHKVTKLESDVIDLCSSDDDNDGDSDDDENDDDDGETTIVDASEVSHEMSEMSGSTVKFEQQSHMVQPTHNTLLFVDCSLPSDHLFTSGVETITDPRLQLTSAVRSQYDSTANLLITKQKQPTKLYATTQTRVNYQQIQQDKENRIYTYLSEQTNNTHSAAYIYEDDDLDMDGPIVSTTSLPANNMISIDLTL